MTMDASEAYRRLCELAVEIEAYGGALSLLRWDQETGMPKRGNESRSRHVGVLAARIHKLEVSTRVGEWIACCLESDDFAVDSWERVNVELWQEERERELRLPEGFIREESESSSRAQVAWVEARRKNDFAAFLPHLQSQVALKRQRADYIGYEGHRYDALLCEYERGWTTAAVEALFARLRPELVAIADRSADWSAAHPPRSLEGVFPLAAQRAFNAEVVEAMGFIMDGGRIDASAHPFCSRIAAGDVRMTTRYDEGDFLVSFFPVLHEMGHGLYGQGLPEREPGMPAGRAVSLGVHESQSRLWENHVGRSLAFWRVWLPRAAEYFPQLAGWAAEEMVGLVTSARRHPIRVEADESRYDLHILLRFELEVALVAGELEAADVPTEWNRRSRDLLGIEVADDAQGCLQDVHWSMGAVGYFPTYTLGNLNAAQLVAAARAGDGRVAERMDMGDFAPLLEWTRSRIHRRGSLLRPAELIAEATGKPPDARDYLDHLRRRYGGV